MRTVKKIARSFAKNVSVFLTTKENWENILKGKYQESIKSRKGFDILGNPEKRVQKKSPFARGNP